MNIQDLKHKRKIKKNKANSRLDSFSWNRSVFLVSTKNKRSTKKGQKKKNQEKEIFTNASKIRS